MAEEDAMHRPQGERHHGKQCPIGIRDIGAARMVGRLDAFAELSIEEVVAFADGPIQTLSQFVVAQQEMDSLGELALQSGQEIHQLVRLIAAGGIAERSVDDLLQDQMAARLTAQVGAVEQATEIRNLSVQVAGNHHLGGVRQGHDPAAATRRRPEGCDGSRQRVEEPIRIWHITSLTLRALTDVR